MGRRGTGVEIRRNAIRVQFSLNGVIVRRTIRRDGKSQPPTSENLADARRTAAEIHARIKAGAFSQPEFFPATGKDGQPLTVGEQLDAWMAVQHIESSTAAAYRSAVRFWKAAPRDDDGARLGDRPLHRLKPAQVLKALTFRPGLNAKTANNYVTVLRRAMDLAVANHAIDDNLVRFVRRRKQHLPFPDPFSRGEVEAIVDHKAREYPAPIANFVEFKFFTGMRPSEVAALRWSDVDLETQRVHVHRAIVQGQDKATTKTNTARMVLLNSRALAAVMRQRAATQLAGDFVFVDPRYGTPWFDERAFRRSYWTPTLTALGLRYRKPYNTRHSYATMMLMAGMTPAFCAAQLGHSVGMLLGTYAKWLDGAHNTLEMQRLEAAGEGNSSLNLSQKQPRSKSAGTRATRGNKPLARVK